MPVDIVLAGAGLEDEFLDRAIDVRIEGIVVPVKYFGGVYLPTEEHDLVIARQRSISWKEVSDAEKVRDRLSPPDEGRPGEEEISTSE